MKKFINQGIILIFLIVLSTACKPSQNKLTEKISTLEKNLSSYTFGKTDTTKLNLNTKELLKTYQDFAKYYPDDSFAPTYIFRAANLCLNINKPKQAIKLFDELIKKYPSNKRIPDGIFIKAFIYDNSLKDYVQAKKFYEEFLTKYPQHPFADDAKNSIKYLGKSPEEILDIISKEKGKQ